MGGGGGAGGGLGLLKRVTQPIPAGMPAGIPPNRPLHGFRETDVCHATSSKPERKKKKKVNNNKITSITFNCIFPVTSQVDCEVAELITNG